MSYDRKSEGVSGPARSLRSPGGTPGKRTLVESLKVRPATSAKAASKPKRSVSNQAAIASLTAAQHCFDDAVHDVAKGKHGEQGNAYIYEREGKSALAHFQEVRNALDRTDADNSDDKLNDQAVQMTFSFREFVARWDDAADFGGYYQVLLPLMNELSEERAHIAGSLALTRDDEEGVRHKRIHAKSDDHYDAKAIAPAMDLACIEARDGYALLRKEQKGKENRWQIVEHTTVKIMEHLPYATNLLVHLDAKKNATKLSGVVEHASVPMIDIDDWIWSRQGNERMKEAYAPVVRELDTARAAVGLRPIGDLRTELQKSEEDEATDEADAMIGATIRAQGAIDALFEAEMRGINVFQETAGLKDPEAPESPDIRKVLFELALTAALGNIGGSLVGSIVKHVNAKTVAAAAAGVGAELGKEVTEETIAIVEGVATDLIEGVMADVSSRASQAGISAADKTDSKRAKARAFYVAGLQKAASSRQGKLVEALAATVEKRRLMPVGVQSLALAMQKAAEGSPRDELIAASVGWANLVQNLTIQARGGEMDTYFGGKNADGDKKPSLYGTHGVVRMVWKVDDDMKDPGGTPSFTMKDIEVNGMNDVILASLLEDAHFQIGSIDAIREIEIHLPDTGVYNGDRHFNLGAPTLVIDRSGNVVSQDIYEYGLDVYVWNDKTTREILDTRLYGNPQRLWSFLKKKKVDRSLAPDIDASFAAYDQKHPDNK